MQEFANRTKVLENLNKFTFCTEINIESISQIQFEVKCDRILFVRKNVKIGDFIKSNLGKTDI